MGQEQGPECGQGDVSHIRLSLPAIAEGVEQQIAISCGAHDQVQLGADGEAAD